MKSKTFSNTSWKDQKTIEKIRDKDACFSEKIRILFGKQGITIIWMLIALSMNFSTTVLAITGVIGGGGQDALLVLGYLHLKMKEVWKKLAK